MYFVPGLGNVPRDAPADGDTPAGVASLAKLMETADDGTRTGERAPTYARALGIFETHIGYCRVCPEWSRFFGHRVYICKTPVHAPA